MISMSWVCLEYTCSLSGFDLMIMVLGSSETADVIQPRLDQLNPMFDDFFSSIDMVVEGKHCFMM